MADLKITLKGARVNAGLTQIQASESSNISIDRLKRAENETEPKLKITEIVKLCEIYGIELTDLKW